MGWFGYTIYSGDETQSCHLDFCKWAKLYKGDDYEWMELHLLNSKTKLDREEQSLFIKNINGVLKKMPKCKFWDEYNAIEWQMLLALFVDNDMTVPKVILEKGVLGTEFLMGEHASDFKEPSKRRQNLKNFIIRAKKLKKT